MPAIDEVRLNIQSNLKILLLPILLALNESILLIYRNKQAGVAAVNRNTEIKNGENVS